MKDKEKKIDKSWRAKMVVKGIYKDSETTSEEMIEEMAREIYDALLNCRDNLNCHKCEFRHDAPFCKAEYIAKAISEHYQPKLPEDSVVLTLEELEEKYEPSETFMAVARELEELKQDLEGKVVLSKEEYEELKFTKNVLELREETIKYLEDANIRYSIALENKGKETAEKILQAIDFIDKKYQNYAKEELQSGMIAKAFTVVANEIKIEIAKTIQC